MQRCNLRRPIRCVYLALKCAWSRLSAGDERAQDALATPPQKGAPDKGGTCEHVPTVGTERQNSDRIADDERRHQDQERAGKAAVRSITTPGICDARSTHPEEHYGPDDCARYRPHEASHQYGGAWKTPEHDKGSLVASPIFWCRCGASATFVSHCWRQCNTTWPARRHALPGSVDRVHRHKNRTRSSPQPWV